MDKQGPSHPSWLERRRARGGGRSQLSPAHRLLFTDSDKSSELEEDVDLEKQKFIDKDMLGEDLLKMLEQGSLHDVKIKLGDGEISANKDILMARSEYFATMFSNNKFIEGETGSVDMSHCSKAVMERIIKFLFSGEVTFDKICLAQLLELSYWSDMMLLAKFKANVEEYVVDKILGMEDNVDFVDELISGLKLTYRYNQPYIGKQIILQLDLMLSQIPYFSETFQTLPFNLIKDILLCGQKPSDGTASASDRLDAFVFWLTENEASEDQRDEIVQSFNFKEFTAEDLLTLVRNSGLYSDKKIDERVFDIIKDKDQLLKKKDQLIKNKDELLKEKDLIIKKLKHVKNLN